MKKKIIWTTSLFLVLFCMVLPPAQAYVSLNNYGFTLGKYDSSTQNFIPTNYSVIDYINGMRCRVLGPTNVSVSSSVVGQVITFNDKSTSQNNGYPVIGEEKWDEWINYFDGENAYVKKMLLKSLNTKSISVPGRPSKVFANFGELANFSGGAGVDISTANAELVKYQKTPKPWASLTVAPSVIKPGEKVKFTINAKTFSAYGKALYINFTNNNDGYKFVNNKYYSGDKYTSTLDFTPPTAGTYTFTLSVKDVLDRQAPDVTVTVIVSPVPVDPPINPPTPPPVADSNIPPTAVFRWPTTCYEGETVKVSESSFDTDGKVVDWTWNWVPEAGVTANLGNDGDGGTIKLDNVGTYDLKLTVMDDDGATDAVTHLINVTKAVPVAVITQTGTLKENRKVILSSANSRTSSGFPIDNARDEWTITPVTGGTVSDIKYGTRSGPVQEMLFKKEGTYRVGLRVHNAKYSSEWTYKDLIIGPDLAPAANYYKATIAFRNPSDAKNASLTVNDKTFSLDNDIIAQRTWKYKYDSDNDGSFLDESWVTLDTGNKTQVILKTSKVGKYLFEVEAKESFGQPTIPAFIVDADYRRGDTSLKPQADKIIDVKNLAPVTSFSVTSKPKVDIVFSQGFLSDYYNRFPNMVGSLESIVGNKLRSKNIDYAFYNTTAATRGGIETINKYSNRSNTYGNPGDLSYSWGSTDPEAVRTYDFGKVITRNSVTDFRIRTTRLWDWGSYSIYYSIDGTTWYGWWYGYADEISITPSNIPVQAFRYIAMTNQNGNDGINENWVNLSYDNSLESVYGLKNYVSGASPTAWVLDAGKNINKNSIDTFLIQYGRGWSMASCYLSGLSYYVSADGINWSLIASRPVEVYIQDMRQIIITKAMIPIQTFRYTKVVFPGYTDLDILDQLITIDNTPRATLSDIQTRAQQTPRTGATKYVISLAEEPFLDTSPSNLDTTANIINQNNTNLVVLADAANTASAQQLAVKATKQRVITTTPDMSVPLEQLADYIISTATSTTQAGFITLLLGQTVGYNPTYSDYETDPKVTENWNYVHTPGFLDNNSGTSFYHNKTISGPVDTLDKVGKYDVKFNAQDDPASGDLRFLNYRMWSEPSPTTVIVHRKPIADFNIQAGTLNITDLSYDPDFQFRRPDKGVIAWLWKWRAATSSTWTVGHPSGITALGNYVLHLEVKDVYGVWSDPAEKTVTVNTLQKPPVVDFTWTPLLIFEGDNVFLRNLSYDPNGDPLTYLWTVFDPTGNVAQFTTKDVSLNRVLPGTYWVTLRAWDPGGLTDAVTKSLAVNPLDIKGYVNHTPEWNANRIRYNRYYSGTDDLPRSSNMFWAGEKFILHSDTTDTTGSTTQAQSVRVDFLYNGLWVNLNPDAGRTAWAGELWREDFANIPDGTYTFRFTATYSNGIVRTDDVPIIIQGSWQDYYRFHRVW